MLIIESPLSEKHPWTTATLETRSFAVTRPPHVSLVFDLILPRRHFQAAYSSAITKCVSELLLVLFKSSDEEIEMFLARVKWLPVTSRSHMVTDGQTDKHISIMIGHYNAVEIRAH